jgi:2,4-dienoyl-CoA reductase-like NADH-dependent reductase (Old Yellow Enzyme family)
MKPEHKEIFSPMTIGGIELRNRIVAPPMVQVRPITSPEGIGWYRRLAAGGAGLVIVEATGVPCFGDELTADNLEPLVHAIHNEGAAAAIQLFPIRFGASADLNQLAADDIKAIIQSYGRAAMTCRDAGFDGVEPHGAHGYLLNQFFMPDKNQRTDKYGGSPENRCRLGVEIVREIKGAAGDSLLILYRHTPAGDQYTIDDSLAFAARLLEAGVAVLDISPARAESIADLAAPFKARFDVPVIAVNGMNDPDNAAQALSTGRCDLVGVARGLIADAQWPQKVQQERFDDILECEDCNKCFIYLKRAKPVKCAQWTKDEVAPFVTQ